MMMSVFVRNPAQKPPLYHPVNVFSEYDMYYIVITMWFCSDLPLKI